MKVRLELPTAALGLALALGGFGATLTPTLARAQPMAGGMPDPRAISGRPLPDRSMAPGTVSVRVGRRSPANPVVGVEVTALMQDPRGESRKRTAKTDAEGRALFEGMPAGSRFHAEVVVDGETVASNTFEIPESGGVRTMLIAGLGPPPSDGASGAEAAAGGGEERQRPFTMGLISGSAHVDPTLPVGSVVVQALDEERRLIPNQEIELAHVETGTGVQVMRQTTGPDGIARFSIPATRAPAAKDKAPAAVGAAVVMRHGNLRLGTEAFTIPTAGGVSVELHVPRRTADPSIITIGSGGRIILQLRDEAPGFIETLPLENHSDQVFDPGAGGIEIPLPTEFLNAEGAEGEHKIEVRKGVGVAVHGIIPPHRPLQPEEQNRKLPDEVTLGFVLPATGSTRTFEQRFPNGLGEFTFITEQIPGLTIESQQISGRQDRELGDKKYWLMRGEAIPPGGTLRFNVQGLPAPDSTGREVAAALALALVGATVVLARKEKVAGKRGPVGGGTPRQAGPTDDRAELVRRRERLFQELITMETRSRALAEAPNQPRDANGGGEAGGSRAAQPSARADLVQKLEAIYRDLATLDEQRAV